MNSQIRPLTRLAIAIASLAIGACSQGSALNASQAPMDQDHQASVYPDYKTFAQRYNAIAPEKWKIVDIYFNQDYWQMTLAAEHMAFWFNQSGQVSFNPANYDSAPSAKESETICLSMVRALAPDMPTNEALSFVRNIFSQERYKDARYANLIGFHDNNTPLGCTFRGNGL